MYLNHDDGKKRDDADTKGRLNDWNIFYFHLLTEGHFLKLQSC